MTIFLSSSIDTSSIFLSLIKKNSLCMVPLVAAHEGLCNCGKIDCHAKAKHPLKNFYWKWLASSEDEKVNDWWSCVGSINVGVLTGRWNKEHQGYLVVIDVDVPEHNILKRLPTTLQYRTGKRGHHLWFWSKNQLPNSVCLLAKHVDIRGHNGYVVVPPSTHVNGNEYVFENGKVSEIAQLPDWVWEEVKEGERRRRLEPKTKKTALTKREKTALSVLETAWARMSITEIREELDIGTLIPVGVRNTVIHRLLSSDRAKGTVTNQELWDHGNKYVKSLEEKNSFSECELALIISSVMKYPVYNNSHKRVNEIYGKWMKKNGHKLPPSYISSLEQADKEFFSSLTSTSSSKVGIPLAAITKAREEFLTLKGFKSMSVYKHTLLAQKLKDLGMTRTRTAKFNIWNVEVLSSMPIVVNKPTETTKVKLDMSTEVILPKQEEPLPSEEDFDLEVVKVKVTKHPREQNYPGTTHREYNEKILKSLPMPTNKDELKTFIKTLKPGDVIGFGFNKSEVKAVCAKHTVLLENQKTKDRALLCASTPLATLIVKAGLAEILYRDGKPFDTPEFKEVNLYTQKKIKPPPLPEEKI